MAEFAKSIFGFGGFKKDSNSPSQQSSSSSHLANDQIYSDDQYYSQETNPSQENQFGIDSFDANDNRKKFLPKGLGKITPTTAVSTNGMVYEFTNESTSLMKKQMELATTPLSPGIQANFKGFTYVDDSAMDDHFGKSLRYNTFKNPGSFIPGNPNLPPDEDVIEDGQIDEEDEMEIDQDQHLADEEFVNGRLNNLYFSGKNYWKECLDEVTSPTGGQCPIMR
ncbi:hypothetical protein QCA50_016509 [Cerrena zonata]|uniref:Protein kinase C-terminal domain-containing protein n=1 Tax=Cerrena zonata TaxID=2478898 RepID=A0AAW0FNC6_9APHY